jgi:hypothetical protein
MSQDIFRGVSKQWLGNSKKHAKFATCGTTYVWPSRRSPSMFYSVYNRPLASGKRLQLAIENGHLWLIYPLKLMIFSIVMLVYQRVYYSLGLWWISVIQWVFLISTRPQNNEPMVGIIVQWDTPEIHGWKTKVYHFVFASIVPCFFVWQPHCWTRR